MDLAAIRKLVAAGESETLELKASTASLRAAGKTISAFLNSKGGTILIGVTPSGELRGQAVADSTLQEVAAVIERIEPRAQVGCERTFLDASRAIIAFSVDGPGPDGPYSYDGRFYRRIGSTNSVMSQQLIRSAIVDSALDTHRWESVITEEYSIEDLDHEEILRTVRTGAEKRRIPEAASRQSIEAILDLLDLRRDGRLSRAAVVLYAKRPWPTFPQCELSLARFKGTNRTEFVDQLHAKGHVFALLDEAELFWGRHVPLAGRIPLDAMRRVDTPLYPFEALREALINAIIHRDYTLSGSSLQLAIYDDRIEVWSPGGFPKGIYPSMLKEPHRSVRRNHTIAEVVYRAGLIEKWGRGTLRILELCQEAGNPEPRFEEVHSSSVVVTFPAPSTIAERAVVDDALGLTPLQMEILQLLSPTRKTQMREILDRTDASERTALRALKGLVDLGLAVIDGAGRSRGYRRSPEPEE